jgi:hypothetical protein
MVYGVYNLDYRRAGFPARCVSEAHVTITTDHEYHITLVSHDGERNRYYYDGDRQFLFQTGYHANYLYNYYRQAYNDVERDSWDQYSSIAPYMA